jgi:hypothetical protein
MWYDRIGAHPRIFLHALWGGGATPGGCIHVFLKNSVDLIDETGYNENMLLDLRAKCSSGGERKPTWHYGVIWRTLGPHNY